MTTLLVFLEGFMGADEDRDKLWCRLVELDPADSVLSLAWNDTNLGRQGRQKLDPQR